MPAATRTIDIDAPLEVVLETITDFPSYPRFVPDTEATTVVRDDGTTADVRFVLRLIRRLEYTIRCVRRPDGMSWSLVDGAFSSNDGDWTLVALDDAHTRATYTLDVQVGVFVPGNIVRSLVSRSLPDTLAAFKAEAERRTRS